MVYRTASFLFAIAVAISAPGVEALGSGHDEPTDKNRPRVFRIHVVEEGTGRGVPLVELKTVNQIRYVTDSNGIVAFDEPGLFNRKVFFTITSHGYEVDKDGLGFRGKALEVTAGGSADIVIRRLNVARRLYRVTGAGIYRDSVLTGDAVPIREPLLNGMVFGQDSVVNAVYQGKVHWFWGDTNRPDYPLGNFHVPGATSDLPGRGGLEPEIGINLGYFVDDQGFARPTAAMPGEGPTWISGLVVLKDQQARERMFAVYAKIRKALEVYERGLCEFNPETQRFEKIAKFPAASAFAGEFPDGHPFLYEDRGVEYIYYASPYPLVRVPADPEHLKKAGSWEAFTCLKQGTRASQLQFEHGTDGTLRYSWKTDTPLLRQDQQTKLIVARRIKPEEALLHLRDIDSGNVVVAHGGSVYWNAYRQRWVMICVESYGSTSRLGEVWYAEADTPLGPWVYARKIVTHDKYSFYNPKQHPMFDKDGGRVIFFEGTYTTTFSGSPDPTPRYDYNQVMYQLDLSDARLTLPVAIYEDPSGPGGSTRLVPKTPAARGGTAPAPRSVAFFAPDRPGIASLPVYEQYDSTHGQTLHGPAQGHESEQAGARPLFYLLPADVKDYTAATVPFYEYRDEASGRQFYAVDPPNSNVHSRWTRRLLGRVWRSPARSRRW
jgi:hypothetical protein